MGFTMHVNVNDQFGFNLEKWKQYMLVEFKKRSLANEGTYKDTIAELLNPKILHTRQIWNNNSIFATFKEYEEDQWKQFKDKIAEYKKTLLEDETLHTLVRDVLLNSSNMEVNSFGFFNPRLFK